MKQAFLGFLPIHVTLCLLLLTQVYKNVNIYQMSIAHWNKHGMLTSTDKIHGETVLSRQAPQGS